MVIQNSEVSMASKSSFAREMKLTVQSETKPFINLENIQVLGDEGKIEDVTDDNPLLNAAANRQVRLKTMEYLFRILLFGRYMDEDSEFGRMLRETFGFDDEMAGSINASGGSGVEPVFVQTTKTSYYYHEEQSLEFSSTGTAVTADGRKLNFNYSFAMTEAFTQEYTSVYAGIRNCVDPLVINLDDCPTSIADQTFLFDLDGDGELDDIHNLGKGSGFLALDKNEDGEINDGLELFGARTGDGFGELEEYDHDGNGWIDENDPIFTKLRIMTITEKGEKELYGLKESDVGAIFLGRVDTNMVKRDDDNKMTAAYRKSGMFLHEKDGHAGGVQHVDFAT